MKPIFSSYLITEYFSRSLTFVLTLILPLLYFVSSRVATMCMNQQTDNVHKARRPRTAYNYFYKHQRVQILNEIFEAGATKPGAPSKKPGMTIDELLRDYTRKRRRHEKSHGLIPMQSLTKIVAKRWKQADPEARKHFQNLADKDLIRYRKALLTSETAKNSSFAQTEKKRRKKGTGSATAIIDTAGITWSMNEVEALQEIFLSKE